MDQPDTQVVSVRCNHCGAPLQIAGGARFLTCTYCGAQLEVHRSGGAVYTEVLQEIDERTERIERDVQQIKRQNAIEALDREWEMRRQTLMVRNKDGSTDAPSMVGGIAAGLIAVVAGIAWMIFTATMGAPAFFPLFGLLFIIVGLLGAGSVIFKASQYDQEEATYRQRREALLRELSADQTEQAN